MGIVEETVSMEDYEVVAWDNKRLAEFIVSLGLDSEDVGDLIVDGTNEQQELARKIIYKKGIAWMLKYL